jgi:phage-related protein
MGTSPNLKPLFWIASSKADLMRLPPHAVRKFGFGLYLAQSGETHQDAKR